MSHAEGSCDFVVVGSGAGGATAAMILAEAGREVVLLEEGPAVRDEDRGLGTSEAFFRLFRAGGTQVAVGRSVIPVLQGRCVGGTTVVNGAIVWRMPEDVHARCFGAIGAAEAIPLREMERCFDRIERDHAVAVTPEGLLGRNGLLMRGAAEKLGLEGHVIRRNVLACQGSSRCLEACPSKRKQSVEQTYVPRAVARGARLYAGHEVRHIEVQGGRAVGVQGRDAEGRAFRVTARRGVVVAASAVQSPLLLQRSGLGPRGQVGAHFMAHPAAAVSGVYRDEVKLWQGGTQTYEVDHFRQEGFKLETASLPLELAGVRMAGFGKVFQEKIGDYQRTAVWGVQVRAEAEGKVRRGLGGTSIAYTPEARDMERIRRGARVLCEMHLAAGATHVYPGVHGGPEVVRSEADLRALGELPLDPRAWSLIISHVFGTCRMSRDARGGVVGHDFGVHGVKGVWVVDASIFATTPGVNPQHSIMALAMLAAERIAEERAG
ncbi:GMC family oxidoreductase N-terminal domain-containing protein [Chondromyces apiculatus]|uniref:Choline dehydrogenase n=1 Tax=Chondromyces apiculatus DSM 436 TaxID=1192034 RepID=A0A017T0A3_9BACT|nr:GMC family oxidoreductase [Chondromyces apiculatus]EYF02669.1 Choline dehydrogenase [Chondromyces apiculatus DSM 436]